jgi:hypothetical protein
MALVCGRIRKVTYEEEEIPDGSDGHEVEPCLGNQSGDASPVEELGFVDVDHVAYFYVIYYERKCVD